MTGGQVLQSRTGYAVKILFSAAVRAALAAPSQGLAAKITGNPAAGKKVFVTTGCGTCHTLKAAGAKGVIASNLDKKKTAYAKIVVFVTKGTTTKGVMPAYKTQLSAKQIQDVAAFVYTSTH